MDVVALNVDVPVTVSAPLSVIAPTLSTDRFPVIVDAPMFTAPPAVTDTLAPVSRSAPVKELVVVVKLIFLPVATIVVVPPMFNFPVFVTAPADEVTDRFPVRVLAPSTVPVVAAFRNEPDAPFNDTAPVNFEPESVKTIAPAAAVSVVVPPTVQLWLPLSEIAADPPVDVTTTFPVATSVSIVTAPVADKDTLLPVSETLPPNTFVDLVKLMEFPVAVTVVVPVIANVPVFVTAPAEVTVRLAPDPAVIAPRFNAPPLTSAIFTLPVTETAPPNMFPA